MAVAKRVKRRETILVADRLRNSSLHLSIRDIASIQFCTDEEYSCVDMWLGDAVAIQWLPESDIANNSCTQRLSELSSSRISFKKIVLAEVTPANEHLIEQIQEKAVLELQLRFIVVTSPENASAFIYQLIDLLHKPGLTQISKCQPPPDAAILEAVQCLPSVGKVNGKALLSKFGSISGLAKASQEDLSRVVSQSGAARIYNFLHEPTETINN